MDKQAAYELGVKMAMYDAGLEDFTKAALLSHLKTIAQAGKRLIGKGAPKAVGVVGKRLGGRAGRMPALSIGKSPRSGGAVLS